MIGNRSIWIRAGGRWISRLMPAGVGSLTDFSAGFHPEGGDPVLYIVGTAVSNGQTAIFVSEDGASTWRTSQLVPQGSAIGVQQLPAIAACLKYPDTAQGGIFLSTDSGASWRNVLSRDQHVYDVTIDPADPSTLYACGFESSAWKSADAGEHWVRIKGFNFKWGHRVVPDPNHTARIFVTTFGGSVWYGPASSDPDALEDIASPGLGH